VLLVTLIILFSAHDPLISAAIWGLMGCTGLVIHAMFAFDLFKHRIEAATQRELARVTSMEKPKRTYVELSEDGELLDVAIQPTERVSAQKKGQG